MSMSNEELFIRSKIHLEKLLVDCGKNNVSSEIEMQMKRIQPDLEKKIDDAYTVSANRLLGLREILSESMKEEEDD